MEIFLIRALQLILALSLLVLILEFGHFLFARIFKVRVEKFYLFFDWKFSLFKWKPKNSDTEYGIGWVPLGGYCKISGMIDESMDTEQMKKPAESWEYRSKPAWQRLPIIVGGVMFNLILALFIYSMVLFTWGEDYVDMHKMENGFAFSEKAKEIGFRDGDMIVKMDGEEVHELYFNEFQMFDKIRATDLFRGLCEAKTVTVRRDGNDVDINMPESLDLMNINKPENFLSIRIPAVVGGIDTTYAAATGAGIKEGDRIVSIAGNEITCWNEITPTLENLKKEGISTFDIEVMRDSIVQLTASVDSTYTLGIFCTGNNYPVEHISYSFFKSFPAGVGYAMDALRGYVGDFKYVFTSEGSKSVGMFGSIGSLFPKAWNWHEFWLMTAFLSIVLAFMNILPIPALDGGHAVFLIYEMITGKQPSDKFMERAQIVGMLLILGLFILATYNDLMKFVF